MERSKLSVKAFILAGGKGSRSENPQIAKILQEVGPGVRVLDLLFETLVRAEVSDIVFLLGVHDNSVIEAVERKKPQLSDTSIAYIVDEPGKGGASSALHHGLQTAGYSDVNILLLGDTVMSAPLSLYIHQWLNSSLCMGLAIHPNLHPDDSDCLVIENAESVGKFFPKNSFRESHKKLFWPITGACLFNKQVAESFKPISGDSTLDLVVTAESVGKGVFGIKASHYFADSGTPGRIQVIRSDYSVGAISRRGASSRSAVFLDRDGTIFEDIGTSRSKISEGEIPERLAATIRLLNKCGIPVFLVTNQPGIAKGQITENDLESLHSRLQSILAASGSYLDDFIYCPHHPDLGFPDEVRDLKIKCKCRKPNSGMLEALAEKHGIDLKKSWVIGDSSADEAAASKVGANFLHASFDGRVGVRTDVALLQAMQMIGTRIDNY